MSYQALFILLLGLVVFAEAFASLARIPVEEPLPKYTARSLCNTFGGCGVARSLENIHPPRQPPSAFKTSLHQLEHERQMSIDPVGHQLKHQHYELNKQKLINKA